MKIPAILSDGGFSFYLLIFLRLFFWTFALLTGEIIGYLGTLATRNPLEYLEREGRSFLTIHRNGSMLRFTIYWLRNAGYDELIGYMDTFLIDEEAFHRALEQEHSHCSYE